jgi:peroxiredoxin
MTILHPSIGEPAPWFSAAAGSNNLDTVVFDELAGRYIVLFFFGTAAQADVAQVLAALGRRNDLFDDRRALFLGVSGDADDFNQARVCQHRAGQLFLLDSKGLVARRYGVAEPTMEIVPTAIRPVAFIISHALQIIEIVPLTEPAAFVGRIVTLLCELLASPPLVANAPVLVVPRVFDRAFCHKLIDLYESAGGREIGFIESDGKIVERFDPKFRKRLDWHISYEPIVRQIRELLERRLLPMVYRAFQFGTTRIERYLVGCYDAAKGGYFRPHRDNTARLVAHRRFALTINLNEDYEGGHLCFPEFGHQIYRTPPGDAIVFSCSLLHEAMPVTRGRRYAFLSFFYDERSQQIRDASAKKWVDSQKPIKG